MTSWNGSGSTPVPVYVVSGGGGGGDFSAAEFYNYAGGSKANPPIRASDAYGSLTTVSALAADVSTLDNDVMAINNTLTHLPENYVNKHGDTMDGVLTNTQRIDSPYFKCNNSLNGYKMIDDGNVQLYSKVNVAPRQWSFPNTSGNVDILHNGPEGQQKAGNLGCSYLNLNTTTSWPITTANLTAFAYLSAPKIYIGHTAVNSTVKTWNLPTTTADVDFFHTGGNQTKAGSITCSNFIGNASGLSTYSCPNSNSGSFLSANNLTAGCKIMNFTTAKFTMDIEGNNTTQSSLRIPLINEASVDIMHTGTAAQTKSGVLNLTSGLKIAASTTKNGFIENGADITADGSMEFKIPTCKAVYELFTQSTAYLPLTGGTITGDLTIKDGQLAVTNEVTKMYFGNTTNEAFISYHDAVTDTKVIETTGLTVSNSIPMNLKVNLSNTASTHILSEANNNLTQPTTHSQIPTAEAVKSYAYPKTGGLITGIITAQSSMTMKKNTNSVSSVEPKIQMKNYADDRVLYEMGVENSNLNTQMGYLQLNSQTSGGVFTAGQKINQIATETPNVNSTDTTLPTSKAVYNAIQSVVVPANYLPLTGGTLSGPLKINGSGGYSSVNSLSTNGTMNHFVIKTKNEGANLFRIDGRLDNGTESVELGFLNGPTINAITTSTPSAASSNSTIPTSLAVSNGLDTRYSRNGGLLGGDIQFSSEYGKLIGIGALKPAIPIAVSPCSSDPYAPPMVFLKHTAPLDPPYAVEGKLSIRNYVGDDRLVLGIANNNGNEMGQIFLNGWTINQFVTAVNSSSTDQQLPTAKAVKDAIREVNAYTGTCSVKLLGTDSSNFAFSYTLSTTSSAKTKLEIAMPLMQFSTDVTSGSQYNFIQFNDCQLGPNNLQAPVILTLINRVTGEREIGFSRFQYEPFTNIAIIQFDDANGQAKIRTPITAGEIYYLQVNNIIHIY